MLPMACTLGPGKTLEARTVPPWNPLLRTVQRPRLNTMPCSSMCVKRLVSEFGCLIWSCPQQFWKVLTLNAKGHLCHAASHPRFLYFNSSLSPQRRHCRPWTPVRSGREISLPMAHSPDYQPPIRSSLNGTGSPWTSAFGLWPGGETLHVWLSWALHTFVFN